MCSLGTGHGTSRQARVHTTHSVCTVCFRVIQRGQRETIDDSSSMRTWYTSVFT